MDNLSFSMGTLINIGGFILAASALYWKLKIEMAKLTIEMTRMKEECEAKWEKHDESSNKDEAMSAAILSGIGDIKGDVRQLKTDVSWLKKK